MADYWNHADTDRRQLLCRWAGVSEKYADRPWGSLPDMVRQCLHALADRNPAVKAVAK